MRIHRTHVLGLAAAAAVAGLVSGPGVTSAVAKPGGTGSTGSAAVFKVNPVQSSGNQALTDQNDAAAAVPIVGVRHRPAAQPRRVRLPARLLGGDRLRDRHAGVLVDQQLFYNRHQDQFEQVMGYFWVNQAQEYLQSLGFGTTFPGDPEAAVRRQDQPVRRRQQLPDRQAVPHPARQGRRGRRRGRRGDRARVRPRRARIARCRGSAPAWMPVPSARPSGTTWPCRSGWPPLSSTAGRCAPRRPARWTGTRPPTPTPRTASAASTPG